MNNSIFYFFYNFAHQSPWLDQVIIFLAQTFPYIVIGIAGLFLLMHHEVFKAESPMQILMAKKKEILRAFFTGGFAWVIAKILKTLIHTPRPFDLLPGVQSLFPEGGYAFPSGHATFYMALAVSIFLSHKRPGYVFMLFAVIIGLARITAGVHFPVDILGGLALGTLVSVIVERWYRKFI